MAFIPQRSARTTAGGVDNMKTHRCVRRWIVLRSRRSAEAPPIEARGHLVKQPPDGSCLYHSLVHGAKRRFGWKQSATALRKELAAWVASRGVSMRWNGKSLQQWLQFEVARSISAIEYGTLQAKGGWGGAIEIIGFVLQKHVNVWVWVPVGDGRYRRSGPRSRAAVRVTLTTESVPTLITGGPRVKGVATRLCCAKAANDLWRRHRETTSFGAARACASPA